MIHSSDANHYHRHHLLNNLENQLTHAFHHLVDYIQNVDQLGRHHLAHVYQTTLVCHLIVDPNVSSTRIVHLIKLVLQKSVKILALALADSIQIVVYKITFRFVAVGLVLLEIHSMFVQKLLKNHQELFNEKIHASHHLAALTQTVMAVFVVAYQITLEILTLDVVLNALWALIVLLTKHAVIYVA